MRHLRLILGLFGGCAVVAFVGAALFAFLRTTWPAYAAAEPMKAYSLDMLLARLAVGFCAASPLEALPHSLPLIGDRVPCWSA
jgi:hypothetical protein